MKVLVTGATGLVGKPLVQSLASSGHSIVVLSRNPEKAKSLWGIPVSAYAWRAEKEPVPEAALNGVDAVVHLAGEGIADKHWSAKRKQEILDSRVLGTRHLFEGIKSLKGSKPKVVVSSSAIGFYGSRGDEKLSESALPGSGFLSEVCQAWEKELFKNDNLGIRLVAIRTGIVLAAEGGALKKMLPPFKMGVGGPIGSGKQWMSWIHRDDLIGLILHALTHDEMTGPINGVAPNAVTNAHFSRVLGHLLHRPAFMKAPAFAMKLMLGEMSELVLGSQRVLADKAEQLGYHFKYPFVETGLADAVKKKT